MTKGTVERDSVLLYSVDSSWQKMYVDVVVFIPDLKNNLTRSDVYGFFVIACRS